MFWDKWFEPKPFNSGFLTEKDRHLVYFAEFGNPKGLPVLLFNGGPGGSFREARAKLANLKKYRVIMFDQRGCGRSLPLGKTENNTTQDLLDDATRLVNYLKINQKIVVWGASWGATLALLWAEKNADKVSKLLLSQVFLANKAFLDWEFDACRQIYPEFVEAMEKESKGKIKAYYNDLIQSSDLDKQLQAVNRYGGYERILGSMAPAFSDFKEISELELASQKVYMQYASHNFFLKGNEILDNIHKIKEIDTLIVHDRLDLICPFKGAYDVAQALNKVRFVIVPAFGHANAVLRKIINKEIRDALK